ncbi:hypothetical protein Van01_00760 [Micromonospora andamanensis]|uniref:Uncharacterized protein n=1 Tax=Micromonospora andamanensis TaxID=1287068 RepID=A0ABQ4HMK2_9ACTN|nr:hypothetical protein Van01_00760 [Micromonospora andamanensis]
MQRLEGGGGGVHRLGQAVLGVRKSTNRSIHAVSASYGVGLLARRALQVRVTAPVTGSGLPIVVFAHGSGGNMDMYGRLSSTGRHTASRCSSRPTSTPGPLARNGSP